MKFLPVLTSLGLALLPGTLSAVVYSTNFDDFNYGDIAGQGGWMINDPSINASLTVPASGPWGVFAGSLGFVSPVQQSTVYLYRPVSTTPLVGNGNLTFTALFQVQDSTSVYSGVGDEARDTFGFRLRDGSGNNLFSFYLTPFDQDPTPQTDTAYHTMSWNTGTSAPTTILGGYTAQENYAYTLSVTFSPSGANDVSFVGDVNGQGFSGTLPNQGTANLVDFGAFWTPLNGPSAPGANFLLFDNVAVVPEPTSAMLGLFGASLAFLRRRRN